MIADQVAGLGDGSRECRFLLRIRSQQEKGGFRAVTGEDLEESRCPRGVGTVVEGERQFTGTCGGYERAAEDLRPRPARGIGEGSCCQAEDGGRSEAEGHTGCE